jgi:NAD+ kinase
MRIGLHLHPNYQSLTKPLRAITDFLISKDQRVILPTSVAQLAGKISSAVKFLADEKIPEAVDAMFSIGGDGTFLGASRLMAKTDKPVLGIHTGGLGFLADVSLENFEERINDFLNGNYKIEERSVLSAHLIFPQKMESFFAFNDFVIDKGNVPNMIKVRTYVDNHYFNTYRSDGLIISTPTGSTAYSLSAGGPIIAPDLNVIVIAPICPHSLSARPVVLADNQTIKIDCGEINSDVSLIVDGQIRIPLQQAEKIEIRRADFTLKVIRFKGDNFFQTLRTKMNWGLDARGN